MLNLHHVCRPATATAKLPPINNYNSTTPTLIKIQQQSTTTTTTHEKKKKNSKTKPMFLDTDARGLERRPVQRNGKDKSLGRIVLCGTNDVRQLCAI